MKIVTVVLCVSISFLAHAQRETLCQKLNRWCTRYLMNEEKSHFNSKGYCCVGAVCGACCGTTFGTSAMLLCGLAEGAPACCCCACTACCGAAFVCCCPQVFNLKR